MQSIREIYKIGYGPSSSHTIGPVRAAAIFAQKHPNAHKFRVTLYGSLSLTGKGHHTDHALQKEFMPNDLEIVWNDTYELPLHPNGMLFEALSEDENAVIDSWEVYSIGGGDLRDAKGVLNSNKIYSYKKIALGIC
jgi:L-serine dehydratase